MIVMVVIIVGVMIAVVLNMRKKQLKHGKCYRSTLYSFLLMYWICYLLQRRCNKLRRRKYTNKVNLVKNILIIT